MAAVLAVEKRWIHQQSSPGSADLHLLGEGFDVPVGELAGVLGLVVFFFAGFLGAGCVSSTMTFLGGGGGAAVNVLTCARKRVNSSDRKSVV